MSDSDNADVLYVEESLNSIINNDVTTLPIETASYLCLAFCALCSLFVCNHQLSLYPFVSCILILGYAALGTLRKQSIKCEEIYEISEVVASTVPMAAMNGHMLRCNTDISKSFSDFTVLLSLTALPYILKTANPQRTDSIVDIVVWSNICTLCLNSIDREFPLGMVITFWQGFYYLLKQNSHKWLQTGPEIPFNLGLSVSCILFCRLYSCKI